jgi:hypothetical protein
MSFGPLSDRDLDRQEREYQRQMAESLSNYQPRPVPKRDLAPVWQAQQLAEARTYEALTRVADLGRIGRAGVESVARVHAAINDLGDVHPALHNELRQIETETVEAVISILRRHGG